jgi:hypothetical protein
MAHRIDGLYFAPGNLWTAGDPQLGTPATHWTAAWPNNTVQEEIANVIEGQGLTLSKPDDTQLDQAIDLALADPTIVQRPNLLRNGGFESYQYASIAVYNAVNGTTIPGNQGAADHWYVLVLNTTSGRGFTNRLTEHTTGQSDVPGGGRFFMDIDWQTILADLPDGVFFETRLEGAERFSSKQVTMSLYGKVVSGTTKLKFGIELHPGIGGSGGSEGQSTTFTLTGDWARYEKTFTIPSTSGMTMGEQPHLRIKIHIEDNNNASRFHLDNVKLELDPDGVGATAYDPEPIALTVYNALETCQGTYPLPPLTGGDPAQRWPLITEDGRMAVHQFVTSTDKLALGLNTQFARRMARAPWIRHWAPSSTSDSNWEFPDGTLRGIIDHTTPSEYDTGRPVTSGGGLDIDDVGHSHFALMTRIGSAHNSRVY